MFNHAAETRLFRRAWRMRSSRWTRLIGQGERIVLDKEMLIVADGAQVASERFSEFVAIHNGTVVAVFLMVRDCLDHLGRHIWIHVILSQPAADRGYRLLPGSIIKLNVTWFRTRWNRSDSEKPHPWRSGAGEFENSERIDIVAASVDEKGQLVGSTIDN